MKRDGGGTIIQNPSGSWTLRYWLDDRQHTRTFKEEWRAQRARVEVLKLKADALDKKEIRQPSGWIELSFAAKPGIYCLRDNAGNCLYVGKSNVPHPMMRIMQHRGKSWWKEVKRAEWVECSLEKLYETEAYYIETLKPKHNTSQGRRY
jgi:hypothetical protein